MTTIPATRWEGVRMTADPADLAAFAAAHGPRLVRLATLLTGNRHDGEDAVQDAMLAVGRRWSGVRAETAPAYVRTAVVRNAFDIVRARSRSGGEVPELPVEDRGLLRHEEDRSFFDRLRAVPAQQRTVLVLRHYAGLGTREIARTMRISESAVRSHEARALARLRAEVQRDGAR